MKSRYFSLLFFIIPKLCFSQDSTIDKKIYLDSTWNETTSENYKYYRIIKDFYSDKDFYLIKDYYKSGVLQMEGKSKTKDANSKEGEFIFYYENGIRKSISNFSKGMLNGNNFEFYENGNNKEVGVYLNDERSPEKYYKLISFWDEHGTEIIVNGKGIKTEENEYYSQKINYEDGYKHGLLQHINKKYNYSLTEKSLLSDKSK